MESIRVGQKGVVALILHVSWPCMEVCGGTGTFPSKTKALKAIERLLALYVPGWQSRDDFTVSPFHSHLKRGLARKFSLARLINNLFRAAKLL